MSDLDSLSGRIQKYDHSPYHTTPEEGYTYQYLTMPCILSSIRKHQRNYQRTQKTMKFKFNCAFRNENIDKCLMIFLKVRYLCKRYSDILCSAMLYGQCKKTNMSRKRGASKKEIDNLNGFLGLKRNVTIIAKTFVIFE